MIDLSECIPDIYVGEDLKKRLTLLPEYDNTIIKQNAAKRLRALADIYKVYVPTSMTYEIYNKLYIAIMMSLEKKNTKIVVEQQRYNRLGMRSCDYQGIIGGADSFSIIGVSGIGKSTAIGYSLDMIGANKVIEFDTPYCKVIPCIVVQCPCDCSRKGLMLEILRVVDSRLGTEYYNKSQKSGNTIDVLIGTISQVLINHIALLVIDEIQNVTTSKNGVGLVRMLLQLINNSGISIAMVGTPESVVFFEQEMQFARRSIGLKYSALSYNEEFFKICEILWRYQYVKKTIPFSEQIANWLYEHSSGILSVVVNLLHDAQEISILNGSEELSFESLNDAYTSRLCLLHQYVRPSQSNKSSTVYSKCNNLKIEQVDCKSFEEQMELPTIVSECKKNQLDIVEMMKEVVSIEEVVL